MKKKTILYIAAAIICCFALGLGFGVGTARGEVKAHKMYYNRGVGLYNANDELKDSASCYEIYDAEQNITYFAHVEAVQVKDANGKLVYRNRLIVDCPVYWKDGGLTVTK